MAQYRNVKEFLDKINDKYKAHRAEYERLTEQYTRNAEQWKKEVARGWSNYKLQQEAKERHDKEQREIKKDLDELRTTANTDFENILAEADDVFGRYNRATGDKLDLATVELLKSGILSDNEIKALAKDFEGNVAMLRIIGKYAEERGGKDNMEIIISGNDERMLAAARFCNLGKGASGAAMQCMNIIIGCDETTGLVL